MAGVFQLLFEQEFTNQTNIQVTHNLDRFALRVRVIIADEVRPDLVDCIDYDPTDPRNVLTVILTSQQSGLIQVLEIGATSASHTEPEIAVGFRLHNFEATTDPTVNDDSTLDYDEGSLWINTTTNRAYICVDPGAGAAIWSPSSVAFAVPSTIGTANQEGVATTASRSDHIHAHGDQAGGTLHAIATQSVAGFLSAADKTKLDSLVNGGGGLYQSQFRSDQVTTTSTTFQDAFSPSDQITVATAGNYIVLFEGNVAGSSGSTENEIAIGLNNVIVTDSERDMEGNGGANLSTVTHTILTLAVNDVISGFFRKAQGPGNTSMNNRRITILKVQ